VPEDAKRDAKQANQPQAPQADKPQAPQPDQPRALPDDERASTGVRAPETETVSDDSSDEGSDEAAAAEVETGKAAAGATGDDSERTDEPEVIEVIEAVGELIEEGPAEVAGRDLQAELVKAQGEAERHLDDLRRLKADFENYRKRVLREQTARAQSASQALVTKLLPVLDHFELAMTALAAEDGKGSGDLDKMRKGVEMVLGELRDVLRAEGLEPIEAEGKPFDPQRHEAVASVEAGDEEPGTVVGVVRAGYELHGRVIRPAMVRVAQ
jgi:molecular chaperone GrpE